MLGLDARDGRVAMIDTRDIAGQAHIEGDRQIEVELIGQAGGAKKPVLLLHR